MSMTSRERILASILHKQPDRVAIDFGATPSSGISAIAYNNLKKYFAQSSLPTRIYDVVQQLAEPDDVILDKFNVDVIDIGRSFNIEQNKWYNVTIADGSIAQYPKWFKPKQLSDGSWVAYSSDNQLIAKMPNQGTFYDQCCFPYIDGYPQDFKNLPDAMNKVLWSALVHSPWDSASDADFWQKLRANTLDLRNQSQRALVIVCGCNLFEWGTFLRRMDNFLMDLFTEQTKVEALLDALMEQHLSTLEKVCNAVGDIVDVLRFGDDLGIDQGPFMSPEIYRKLFKPRHAKLCSYVKKHSKMHTFLHSCGSIYSLMPDLIESGFEILNPVQTNCKDMEPQKLKKEFGKDVTFWGGGCDTRTILNTASPSQVKSHVIERLKILSPDGGFVFNTVHNILPEVPPENIVAMFDAVHEFNR
ncbi:MAG: uroporphyrinogen decarboxylase family protein [Phycisphaerales bacterium]